MKIDILTLFPNMFKGPFDESIVKRAQEKGLVKINIHNLRKWAKDKHKTVDDRPFGGGVGMVLMVEPIFKALKELKKQPTISNLPAGKAGQQLAILLSPQGKVFNQKMAQRLSKVGHFIFICGHYEGVDERIRKHLVDEEISIGDYVLTGGELPAMLLTDTIVRLIPGVLEKPKATKDESFSTQQTANSKHQALLEYPQYTRPANFKGWKVPNVLLSGDHKKIAEWRKKKALKRTKNRRPDLL